MARDDERSAQDGRGVNLPTSSESLAIYTAHHLRSASEHWMALRVSEDFLAGTSGFGATGNGLPWRSDLPAPSLSVPPLSTRRPLPRFSRSRMKTSCPFLAPTPTEARVLPSLWTSTQQRTGEPRRRNPTGRDERVEGPDPSRSQAQRHEELAVEVVHRARARSTRGWRCGWGRRWRPRRGSGR